MLHTTYTINVIEPEEGYILVKGELRSFKVFLADGESADDWTEEEITEQDLIDYEGYFTDK